MLKQDSEVILILALTLNFTSTQRKTIYLVCKPAETKARPEERTPQVPVSSARRSSCYEENELFHFFFATVRTESNRQSFAVRKLHKQFRIMTDND